VNLAFPGAASDKAAPSQQANRKHYEQPSRPLRTLKRCEDCEREPGQGVLEPRERMDHAPI
jgi:hypothetical protein